MHVLHSLFSLLVDLYSTAQQIFFCHGELPQEGLPPVVELPVDVFGVRRSVRAVPRADQISHMEGFSPSVCQSTPCKRVGKAAEGGSDLDCQGITFVAPDGATRLLETSRNIEEVSQFLFPILVGRAPPFEDMLDWPQFAYTADRTRSYVASASVVLVLSTLLKGDSLFPAIWRHLLRRFPGTYAPTLNMRGPLGPDYLGYPKVAPTPTTIGPLGHDYSDGSQVDWAPERRDRDVGEEVGVVT